MSNSQQELSTYAKSFVATMNSETVSDYLHQEPSLSEHRKAFDNCKIYYTNNIDCLKMEGIIILRLSKIDYSYEDMFTLTLYDENGSIRGCCSLNLIEKEGWKIDDIIILKDCSVWENEYLNVTGNNVVKK